MVSPSSQNCWRSLSDCRVAIKQSRREFHTFINFPQPVPGIIVPQEVVDSRMRDEKFTETFVSNSNPHGIAVRLAMASKVAMENRLVTLVEGNATHLHIYIHVGCAICSVSSMC